MLTIDLLETAIFPVMRTTPGRGDRTTSGVPAPATVRTRDCTATADVRGRQSILAARPGEVGVAVMSMTFSLRQIGESTPSGQPSKARDSRSSITTSPLTRRIPAARTCRASRLTAASGWLCGTSAAPASPVSA